MSDAVLSQFKKAEEEKAVDATKKLRVGIIGTGGIANAHMQSYKRMPDVEVVALADIIPSVPQGVMRYGVVVYAMLIAFMLWSALQQRSLLFAIGAGLFLASDMVLAWNKFVEPVSYSGYYILVPYYLAQWLLFIRSTKWWGRQMEKE